MSETEVVVDGVEGQPAEGGSPRRNRRWWGLLVVVLLLLLLLCGVVTSLTTFTSTGPQQARFVARNLECLQCHSELIPDFSAPTVHSPFATKACVTCHTPHGRQLDVTVSGDVTRLWERIRTGIQWLPLRWWLSFTDSEARQVSAATASSQSTTTSLTTGPSALVLPDDELCWMCHGDLGAKLDDKYTHAPFSNGRCVDCHNPHASNNASLLTQAPNKLCFTCHPIGMQLDRAQVHPSAKNGWCVDCHDPHASDFKGIIVARQRELCFRCHPSVAVKSGMPTQHAPFANDDCTGCHEPHGSDVKPLLDAAQPDLCYKCHPAIQNQFARASRHPVGVNLTCGSCHDPHAAQYAGLLTARDNAFCYQCHGFMQTSFERSEHTSTRCVSCHTPHGSDFTPILRERNPSLCLGCHEPASYDDDRPGITRNNHPVETRFYDVNNRSQLTCSSSCHDPHGTQYASMLRNFEAGQDGNCLLCHAVTEGKRVGIDF